MRPLSSTQIISHERMVERRWAIINDVRLASSVCACSSASCTIWNEWMKIKLVQWRKLHELVHWTSPEHLWLRPTEVFWVDEEELEQWQYVASHHLTKNILSLLLAFHSPNNNTKNRHQILHDLRSHPTFGNWWMKSAMLAFDAALIISSIGTFSSP